MRVIELYVAETSNPVPGHRFTVHAKDLILYGYLIARKTDGSLYHH